MVCNSTLTITYSSAFERIITKETCSATRMVGTWNGVQSSYGPVGQVTPVSEFHATHQPSGPVPPLPLPPISMRAPTQPYQRMVKVGHSYSHADQHSTRTLDDLSCSVVARSDDA